MSTYTEHEQRGLDQEGGRAAEPRNCSATPSALDRLASAPAIMVGSAPPPPSMLPTYEELTALGERIVAECNARLVRLGEVPMSSFAATSLRHDIVGAMIDVRHEASDYASDKTWKRVYR